jgi:hypothetical protein
MPFLVIALDRDTARLSLAEIRKTVLETGEVELCWPRIPIEIDDLDQLADVLEGWGVTRPVGASAVNIERALDRSQVWTAGGIAVRRLRGARRKKL